MKIFDFNIHLPQKQSPDVNEVIEDDLTLSAAGLSKGLEVHAPSLSNVSGINVLLFNQALFADNDISGFAAQVKQRFEHCMFTALIDFRRPQIHEYLERTSQQGVNAYMFNSYLQKIREEDFDKVLTVCQYAEALGKIICIDGSYGTSKMYTYDNMKLACFVADHIARVPIIIIHSGGYRAMEAMLLAMDKRNVILDTSFSLNYYLGSSLESDYAFIYRKLGAERVVFGSDVPYMKFDVVFHEQLGFFERFGFSSAEIDRIFYQNAVNLAHGSRK